MRTLLPFSLLILALCVGCTQTVPEPSHTNNATSEASEAPEGTFDPSHHEHLVEPIIRRQRPPAESAPTEEATEETSGVLSPILGKYAAQVVPPPVVPLPPVEDLTAQIDEYIKKMGESLEFLDGSPRYEADASDIVRDANALALVALAVGLAEDDSKYKKSASHIIEATKILAAAKSLEEGQRAHAALKASLTNTEAGKPLSWSDKVARLTPAMKALPNLSSAVKRVTDTERKLFVTLGRPTQQIFGQIAAMAAISQGTIPNTDETMKPDAVAEWKKYCEEFRDAAIKVNAVTRQYAKDLADDNDPDYALFNNAYRAMVSSCDDCHRAFYPQAVGKE